MAPKVLNIFVEGGVKPKSHEAKARIENQKGILENTEKFRYGFSKLLEKKINLDNVKLIIQPHGGYIQTTKAFLDSEDKNKHLLIDLEREKSEKQLRIKELDLLEYNEQVFFMVQEMEAWFLSQPEILDKYYSEFKKREYLIPSFDDYEKIKKPSKELNTQIQRKYLDPNRKTRKGDPKKVKYGKLKDAPGLLALLDLSMLMEKFEDVKLLVKRISS